MSQLEVCERRVVARVPGQVAGTVAWAQEAAGRCCKQCTGQATACALQQPCCVQALRTFSQGTFARPRVVCL